MTYIFEPKGVCSSRMEIELRDGVITDLRIENGCSGNLCGIIRLVKGRRAETVAGTLKGIRCGNKDTSCPDQLAVALMEAVAAAQQEGLSDAG